MSEAAASSDGMTAKQRRLAKRAAARAATATAGAPTAPPAAPAAPMPDAAADGLTAKQRRLAKRAAARAAEAPAPAPVPRGAATSTAGRTTAKERRLAKRAAARGEAAPALTQAPVPPTTTAKERRLAKRAAARAEAPAAPTKRAPLVAFVGQLHYSTTKERIEQFFRSQGVEGSLKVRLLTDAKTKRSRGMAFVECETAEALYACVACHHAHLDGRRVNVEKSAGGGKATKKDKLKRHRERQDAKIEESVDRVIGEFVSQGRIEERVFDEGVRKLLQRRSGRVANMALEEFASLEGRESFDNPAAYLTKIVCRISAEENPFEKFSTKACEPEILPPRRLEDVSKRERSPSVEAVPESAEVALNAKERRRLKRAKLQKDQEGVDAIFAGRDSVGFF
jgi:RNA recognition motif-containing protein